MHAWKRIQLPRIDNLIQREHYGAVMHHGALHQLNWSSGSKSLVEEQ